MYTEQDEESKKDKAFTKIDLVNWQRSYILKDYVNE